MQRNGFMAWLVSASCVSGQVGTGNEARDSREPYAAGDSTGDDTTQQTGDTSTAEPFSLWFFNYKNHQVAENVSLTKGLIDRAAAAGYSGMVLADYKLYLLTNPVLPAFYFDNLNEVLSHAAAAGIEVLPAAMPFGYSEGVLRADANLAEGQPVVGAPFRVSASGDQLELDSGFAGIADGGFEQRNGDTFTAWAFQDDAGVRTVADTSVFRSGSASLRITPGTGNARINQPITVVPNRQYHVRFWLRTDELDPDHFNVMLFDRQQKRARNHTTFDVATDQDWTRYDFVANSGSSTELTLYLGIWSGSSGTAWFDDVSVEEIGLVNVIRRDGAPVAARDGGGAALTLGVDLQSIPAPPDAATGTFDHWHTPPVIGVPVGSRLESGDPVVLDYVAVTPVHSYQVGACLTAPGATPWIADHLDSVAAAFPGATGFFFQYDEMRQMNTCAGCRATGLSAGALLAGHVAAATATARAAMPGADIYVWSDMFDPNHNAVDNYYLVEGDISGSWEGLPADAVVFNWHLRDLAPSLEFFAGRGHRQIIAGYYDSGDGNCAATELAQAAGVPGVIGMMYTTWVNDYSQLETYAASALSAR